MARREMERITMAISISIIEKPFESERGFTGHLVNGFDRECAKDIPTGRISEEGRRSN